MQARALPLYRNSPLYFSLLLVTALVAFFPSFYSRMGEAKFAHQFHGAMSTLWMLLLIGQGWLMRTRRLALHRTIGKCSIVLAALFVVSGLLIMRDMLTRDSGFAKMFGPRLAFIDLSSVLFFAFAYGAAIYYRRDRTLHARFMVCTALPLLPPALSRALGHYVLAPGASFGQALHISYIVSELIVVALLAHDLKTGKLRVPYLILLGVLLVQQASFELGPWGALVGWIS